MEQKEFFYKDKSGRDYKGTFTAAELLAWENEEDWNGKSLHEFLNEAEEGDEWENASDKITCTKS